MTRRFGKIKIALAKVETLAEQLVERHDERLQRGFRLAASSSVWQLKDGTMTARFVYRSRNNKPGETFTITETITGIR